MTLPTQYVLYFAGDGPKEGELAIEPGWFQLWSPADAERLNREYHVQQVAPGFLGFGSNGGGEMLAFDAEGRVVMIPFVGLSADEARPVASSWSEFVERIKG
jgi:hypothetical protein